MVERSIAARRVTGSNPVLRSFFFPFLPRYIYLFRSICLSVYLSVYRTDVPECSLVRSVSFGVVCCFGPVASFGGSVDATDDVDGPRLRLGSL